MTFWKRQNYENCKRIRVPELGGHGRNGLSTENFHANENTLYDSIMMDTLVQTRRPYNTKSELQDKLWNVGHIICQCRFISYNKCTIWWRIFTAGESAYVEQRVFEKSLSLLNFSGNINLLQKKKNLLKIPKSFIKSSLQVKLKLNFEIDYHPHDEWS